LSIDVDIACTVSSKELEPILQEDRPMRILTLGSAYLAYSFYIFAGLFYDFPVGCLYPIPVVSPWVLGVRLGNRKKSTDGARS
jgi:hypothetical protein